MASTTRSRTPARRATARRAKPESTAAKRIKISVEDLADFNESINFLVHGDSGVGKTPFVGGAPNAIFLSTEKGSISAKRFGSTAKLIRATSWPKVEAAIDLLEANEDPAVAACTWVIVDSATKMQQLLLRHLLELNVEEEKNKADIDIPQVQDHQKWQNMFKRFIDRLIDMDKNVVFVTTSMHKEDSEGEPLVLPDIQGKDYAISQYLCAQMDAVYCLKTVTNKKTDEPEWWLITRFRPPFFAKDRYDALPPIVRAPNMAEVIEAIENSAEAAEPNQAVQKRRKRAAEPADEDDDFDDGPDDDDEEEDDWAGEEENDEEEPEPAPKRRATKAASKPVRSTRTARKSPAARKAAEAEPEEDDEEEQPKPTARRGRPAPRRRAPAKAKAKPKDEVDDDFDPEDEEDDDWDDEEDE
jgi:hypothetical protein